MIEYAHFFRTMVIFFWCKKKLQAASIEVLPTKLGYNGTILDKREMSKFRRKNDHRYTGCTKGRENKCIQII